MVVGSSIVGYVERLNVKDLSRAVLSSVQFWVMFKSTEMLAVMKLMSVPSESVDDRESGVVGDYHRMTQLVLECLYYPSRARVS